jgi:hypothetical protein
MPTPETFLDATKWMAIATLGFALLAAISFVFQWGWRFRLVGATGFAAVLTVGLFGLSFEPLRATTVPGAIPYVTVFDSGAAQIVIKVPLTVTDSELQATLQQAGQNLLRASRLGVPGQLPTIRARTIIHQDSGISELVYLGQIQPNLDTRADTRWSIQIDQTQLARANATALEAAASNPA